MLELLMIMTIIPCQDTPQRQPPFHTYQAIGPLIWCQSTHQFKIIKDDSKDYLKEFRQTVKNPSILIFSEYIVKADLSSFQNS